jgi:RimJ/RimL family protein N-acetyltransferase
MAEIVARTDRLILRREREGDFEAWVEHLNTPEVTAFIGGPATEEAIGDKFKRMPLEWAEQGFSFMIVALPDTGELIGTCGIGRIDAESAPPHLRGAVQIGWTLRADHWGQGYAIEAARAVLDFAFETVGLPVVYGQTSLSNRPSWGLMERLGMRRCPDLDYVDPAYPPEDNPTVIYAQDREAWLASPR